jgi:hypothetical protein
LANLKRKWIAAGKYPPPVKRREGRIVHQLLAKMWQFPFVSLKFYIYDWNIFIKNSDM